MPGKNEGNFVSHFEILGPADNLSLSRAIMNLTDRKFVGIRVWLGFDDLCNHDPFVASSDLFNAFHFEAKHGQVFDQFFQGPIEIDILFQSINGDFHVRRCLPTCGALKLFQKPEVVFVKETNITDAIPNHRNALDTEPEGPS